MRTNRTPQFYFPAVFALLCGGMLLGAPVVSVPNLVGYWRLDEAASAGTAADDSGSGIAGTWSGTPVPDTGVPPVGPPGIGFTNPRCLSFDGVDDYVDLGTSATLNPANAMTLAFWIYPADLTGEQKVIAKWADSPGANYTYFMNLNASAPNFYVITTTGQLNVTGPAVAATTWAHLVATYDSAGGANNLRIYVDGVAAQTTHTGTIRQGGPPLRLGAGSGTDVAMEEPFAGRLDDFRLYHRALTPAEVTTLHQGQLPPAPVLTATGQVSQVSLSWTASAGATQYTVRRGDAMAGPFTTLQTTTGTTYVDLSGNLGQTYFYQVGASNIVGESFSTAVSGTSLIPPPRTNDHDEGLFDGNCACGSSGPPAPVMLLAALALMFALRRR